MPLALGGVGMTLEELAVSYLALARQGQGASLSYLQADFAPGEPRPALLSAEAAWQIAEILEATPRPLGYRLAAAAKGGTASGIAYKTGTSYGFRDAWAVGFDQRHTIVVWAGQADAQPCLACVGITAAAPLLFQLFALLPPAPGAHSHWPLPDGYAVGERSVALPPSLRRLGASPAGTARLEDLEISFPPNGSEIALTGSIPLSAEGGRRPCSWLVDGHLLAVGLARAEAFWLPALPS